MKLAANATNGTILQPGEQFSFNGTTGNTTNGSNGCYRLPLFPAESLFKSMVVVFVKYPLPFTALLLRSNMTIVTRYNHTYPSSYVPIGLDATVSYGSLDFVFRNDTDYPVYIAAGMDGTTVWVTFYGYQSPEYDTIEPSAWITENISKPTAEYNTDNSLAPNPNPLSAARLKRSGNPGYKTAASRTYYKNGVAVKQKHCHPVIILLLQMFMSSRQKAAVSLTPNQHRSRNQNQLRLRPLQSSPHLPLKHLRYHLIPKRLPLKRIIQREIVRIHQINLPKRGTVFILYPLFLDKDIDFST